MKKGVQPNTQKLERAPTPGHEQQTVHFQTIETIEHNTMNTQTTMTLAGAQDVRPIYFLGMNAKTASAVLAARPELKGLKRSAEVGIRCRKLGNGGDPKTKPVTYGEMDGCIVVGFSIPANIAAKAEMVIEIPVGKAIERNVLGNELDAGQYENLAKALGEMARIPLKALITQTLPLPNFAAAPDAMNDEDEDEVQF